MVNRAATAKQETVELAEIFSVSPIGGQPSEEGRASSRRYDLPTALRVVRRMENSAGRGAVFAEIKKKNPLYRLVDLIYSRAGSGLVQPLFLFAYMIKCLVSLGPFDDEQAEAVAISHFGNERHTIDRVAALVPDLRLLHLSMEPRHALRPGPWASAAQMTFSLSGIWSFLRTLARTHGFMPAARIASALAFYMRFSRLFAERPALRAAIVASNYSPEAVGLAAAAHRMGRRVVYANHAPVPANGAIVPPVLADCALFYGDVISRTYERRSRCTAEVALIGQPWIARPIQWRDEVRTVGIFLTCLTREDKVAELVGVIRAGRPDLRILIRNHPVALLKSDFSALATRHGNIEVTLGTPLDEDITACDLIICGNSGVAMNALSGGRPVAYMDQIDRLKFDCNGFVESGLVCHVEEWSDDIYVRLKRFYFNPKWQSVMRSYDASYGADLAELQRSAAETIGRYLGVKSSGPQSAPIVSVHEPTLSRRAG